MWAMMSGVRSEPRLIDLLVPFLAVGGTALLARLLANDDGSPAFYLLPLAMAVVTGASSPYVLGSVGAWLGWSAGIALGWLIDTGYFWLIGPAAYGLPFALLPHALASLARTRFGAAVKGEQRPLLNADRSDGPESG